MSFADLNTLTDQRADTFCYTQSDIDSIITQFSDPNNPFIKDDSILKRQFESLKRKVIQYNLHTTTLVEYLKAKRIPRGLRINLKPSFCREDKEFCTKWYHILNKCSLDLIALTIEGIQGQIHSINQAVIDTQKKLETQLTSTDLKTYLETVNTSIDQYKTDTLALKLRKYRRDLLDYEEGRVYTWRDHIRPRRPEEPRTYSRQTTDSSISSDSGRAPFLEHTASRPQRQRRQGGDRRGPDHPFTRSQARRQI